MPRNDTGGDRDDRGRDDEREFSAQERVELRAMMVSHKRVEWLWSSVGIWMKWIFAVAAGLVAIKLLLADLIKGWFVR